MNKFNTGRPSCVMDTECLLGYWSIGFRSMDGRRKVYELFDGNPLDKKGIATIFRKFNVYSFNGIKYDIPMILLAMSGATTSELKRASDELIQFGVPHWTFMERHGLSIPDFVDHIDLMNVSPGAAAMPSLKIYAGRMHSRRMQELPIEIDEHVGELAREVVRTYHGNDLEVTADMVKELESQLQLRVLMSEQYGVDLRSKSDAQIAEAVIKAEIEKITGRKLYKPEIKPGYFEYTPPAYIKFQTAEMREILAGIRRAKFVVDGGGVVKMPDYLKDLDIKIGGSTYRMGLGGLHSMESRASHYSNDEYVLLDRDVTSYYPNIILGNELFPKHIGAHFLKVYRTIYERRIAAKKSGDKNTSETLKIVLNGSFGKFGSPYSVLYSPNLMIQTTITGQLAILMLIEAMELEGFQVVSANTDGFVTRVPRKQRESFNEIIAEWERSTRLETEETEYMALHSRDVNNYIALKKGKNGKIEAKLKGTFTASGPGQPGAAGLKKNPNMDICNTAVVEYLSKGTPIEETIEWCPDVRQYLTVRRVTGGALDQDGNPVGKALRWYYSKAVQGGFTYASNAKAVPESMGAKLMMELLDHLPTDIDYDYYIREAYAILEDVGVAVIDPRLKGRKGTLLAKLPDQKTYHEVNAATGIAACGLRRKSIRESWEEAEGRPMGRAYCSKCKKGNL